MTPFEYQSQLWEKHRPENEKSHKRHQELIKEGHLITMEGKIEGPYLTNITRLYSNGESLAFVQLSSLYWTHSMPLNSYGVW